MAGLVFVPYSTPGHVNPMLPVVTELVARGTRVRVVVGRRFADRVAAVGAMPVVVPREHEVRVPAGWWPADVVDRMSVRARRWSAWRAAVRAGRLEFAADRPDAVVVDPMAPWAKRLARSMRLPTVTFWTTHARPGHGHGWALVNSLPELQPHRHRLTARFRFVGPLIADTDPGAVPAGLPWTRIRRGPTLLVSPGTVFARSPAYFRDVVEQFAGTEWTVLIATGHTPVSALGGLPPNIVARRWLPQLALLPHATVFVTHGGMNSVQEALSVGVPMVVTPRSREQCLTANRLGALGLGRRGGARLRHLVEEMAVDERVRAAHRAMRDRLRQVDGPALAADALSWLAR